MSRPTLRWPFSALPLWAVRVLMVLALPLILLVLFALAGASALSEGLSDWVSDFQATFEDEVDKAVAVARTCGGCAGTGYADYAAVPCRAPGCRAVPAIPEVSESCFRRDRRP